jgi:hypothetical protein
LVKPTGISICKIAPHANEKTRPMIGRVCQNAVRVILTRLRVRSRRPLVPRIPTRQRTSRSLDESEAGRNGNGTCGRPWWHWDRFSRRLHRVQIRPPDDPPCALFVDGDRDARHNQRAGAFPGFRDRVIQLGFREGQHGCQLVEVECEWLRSQRQFLRSNPGEG